MARYPITLQPAADVARSLALTLRMRRASGAAIPAGASPVAAAELFFANFDGAADTAFADYVPEVGTFTPIDIDIYDSGLFANGDLADLALDGSGSLYCRVADAFTSYAFDLGAAPKQSYYIEIAASWFLDVGIVDVWALLSAVPADWWAAAHSFVGIEGDNSSGSVVAYDFQCVGGASSYSAVLNTLFSGGPQSTDTPPVPLGLVYRAEFRQTEYRLLCGGVELAKAALPEGIVQADPGRMIALLTFGGSLPGKIGYIRAGLLP